MLKFFIGQITQMSAWIGVLLIIGVFLFPSREYFFWIGVVLLFMHDETIKNWITRVAPGIAQTIKTWLEE